MGDIEDTGQKGLTLKIAAGVFLGIMAALLVYSVPGWIAKQEKEQREEDWLSRKWSLHELKPDEFVARCGKVVENYIYSDVAGTHRDVTVEATNSEGKKEKVTAEFVNSANSGEEPRWELWEVNNYFHPLDDEGFRVITGDYPCVLKPSP